MKYFLCAKTHPGQLLDEATIRSLQEEACARLGVPRVYRSNDGDVAAIDVGVLEEEMANGAFSAAEFVLFCRDAGYSPINEAGEITPYAAQQFLEHKWGQEILTVELPTTEESASSIYVALVNYARQHQFRLWSPMPGVGDIDLSRPDQLPPCWYRYSS